jgi:hypothetical protein
MFWIWIYWQAEADYGIEYKGVENANKNTL